MSEPEALLDLAINRSVLIVTPKQPFLDWVLTADPSPPQGLTLEAMAEDSTAYLIPDIEAPEDLERVLRKHGRAIFENELAGWYTDESMWPRQRGVSTFRKWCDIAVHSMAIDMGDEPIGPSW